MVHRSEIDGLRALAVLPVIAFHAGLGPFHGGFAGVDVFFVISGYLITFLLIRDLDSGSFSLADFYERRARRILPALFVVTAACLPLAWFLLMPADMKDFTGSLTAMATFTSNIFFWQQSDYFSPGNEMRPLLHTWSLAVEEQFYILFPLVLMALWRPARRWVAPGLAAVLAISLAMAHWGAAHEPTAAFYLLPTRAWELLVGSLAAFAVARRGLPAASPAVAGLGLAGLGAIVFAMLFYDAGTPFPGLPALVPVLGTAAILTCAVPGTPVHRLLSMRLFTGIGLISYSAYLWHQPLFAFARHAGRTDPQDFAALSVLTLALAWATWRFVETPFRRPKPGAPRPAGARVLGLAAAACAGVALLGAAGTAQRGFENRVERTAVAFGDVDHLDFHAFLDTRHVDCEAAAIAERAESWGRHLRCKQTRSGRPEIAVVGDSHAEHLFPGLSDALPGRNVAFYIRSQRPYLTTAAFAPIWDELLSEDGPETVVLTFHFASRLADPQARAAFEARYSETVGKLVEAGRQVVLTGDVPRFDADPRRCAYRLRGAPAGDCTRPRGAVDEQVALYDAVLARIAARHGADHVRLTDLFCDARRCRMNDGDTLLYRDSHHLNLPGARRAGAAVVARAPHLAALRRPLDLDAVLSVRADGPALP